MRVLKVSYRDTGAFYITNAKEGTEFDSVLREEIYLLVSDGEIGDRLVFEVIEMTEAELEDLPEFDGW